MTKTRKGSFVFGVNLMALTLFGLAVSFWTLRYTELFEAIGGVLGTGGALVWLAVVWKLLPKDRAIRLRKGVSRMLFECPFSAPLFGTLLLGGTVAANCVGTLQLSAAKESGPVRISIRDSKTSTASPAFSLGSGERVRLLKWTGFADRTTLVVRVSGFPDELLEVDALERVERTVPYSFLRPVVLVRATATHLLLPNDEQAEYSVHVTIDGSAPNSVTFDGHPLWIGCQSMELPQYILDAWDDDLKGSENAVPRALLLQPKALPNGPRTLQPGTAVEVSLVHSNGAAASVRRLVVRPVGTYQDLVQTITL